MKIEFGGDFEVRKTRDEVYAFLSDPERFCPLLPDFVSLEKNEQSQFLVTLRVGISHIRGNARIKMHLAEADRPSHAVYEGKGDVPGGTTELRAGFDLSPSGDGTKVAWSGKSQLSGRLPALAGGLLEPLARKNLERLIESLKAALA